MKKVRIGLVLSLLLTGLFVPYVANATVGTSRPYLELCKDTEDSDCIESVSFKYDGGEELNAKHYGTAGGSENIFYLYQPVGYKGVDGTNILRVEASYLQDQLIVIIGGTGNTVMDPLPSWCNDIPTRISLKCTILGKLPTDLWASVTIRTKTFKPGIGIARSMGPLIESEKLSAGNRVTVSGYSMQMMGYITERGLSIQEFTDQPAGDYINQIWNFILPSAANSLPTQCQQSGSAILSTNVEMSRLPDWNKSESTLDMKTSSSHYHPDGVTVFKGLYFATISGTLAKCLWGIDPKIAAGQASISITGSSEAKDVATITTGYSGGNLILSAANFEFSSPVIKVFMKKAQVDRVTVVPKVEMFKKSTVTCLKKTTIKKVTAIKPKCPTGFKKI